MPRPHGIRQQDYAAQRQFASSRSTLWTSMERAELKQRFPHSTEEQVVAAYKAQGIQLLVWETFEIPMPCTCEYRPYPHLFSNDNWGREAKQRHDRAARDRWRW